MQTKSDMTNGLFVRLHLMKGCGMIIEREDVTFADIKAIAEDRDIPVNIKGRWVQLMFSVEAANLSHIGVKLSQCWPLVKLGLLDIVRDYREREKERMVWTTDRIKVRARRREVTATWHIVYSMKGKNPTHQTILTAATEEEARNFFQWAWQGREIRAITPLEMQSYSEFKRAIYQMAVPFGRQQPALQGWAWADKYAAAQPIENLEEHMEELDGYSKKE